MIDISERLYIKNFLTVKEFDWDIKEFNILAGGMGSGKSICVKLLYFLERILHVIVFYSNINKEDLNSQAFFDRIESEFRLIFHASDFNSTEIIYSYSCNAHTFDLKASWDSLEYRLTWSSEYISARLDQWQNFFGKENTPDISQIACKQIYDSIYRDFAGSFPLGAMFIPASRAIAAITDNTDFPDPFLVEFIKDLKKFVLRFRQLSNQSINNILHIENMIYDKEKGLRITLPNGREIAPLDLSSGQQELLFLLLLIGHLSKTSFQFGAYESIFIEEPSAHLFPQEQKDTIEFIAKVFRQLKHSDNPSVRFFVTTHSPYLLNVVNNIMNRGRLKNKLDEFGDESSELNEIIAQNDILKGISNDIYFNQDEVAAYFIESDGKVCSMIPEGESFLYAEKIEQISQCISDEANGIDDVFAEIKSRDNR